MLIVERVFCLQFDIICHFLFNFSKSYTCEITVYHLLTIVKGNSWRAESILISRPKINSNHFFIQLTAAMKTTILLY